MAKFPVIDYPANGTGRGPGANFKKVTITKITKLLVEKFLVNLTGGNLLLGQLLIIFPYSEPGVKKGTTLLVSFLCICTTQFHIVLLFLSQLICIVDAGTFTPSIIKSEML
nr:hypothetical protein [uncultured Butyrivibrio sp.]